MENHGSQNYARTMNADAVPQETHKGARINFLFVFLAVLLLIVSMIFILPSAYPRANDPGLAQFLGYIVLFAFLWLILAIVVRLSNAG